MREIPLHSNESIIIDICLDKKQADLGYADYIALLSANRITL